jgi:HK97 family phage prohead protease
MTPQRITFGTIALDTRGASADGSIPCVLATSDPIERGGYREILDHSTTAIDLSRAVQGLPLLLFHDQTKPVGRIENIKSDGQKLRGVARFGSGLEAKQAQVDVEEGIIPALSVGYAVHETKEEEGGIIRVTNWTPLECSLVSIPADPNAGMFRSYPIIPKEKTMKVETRTEIEALSKTFRIPGDITEKMIADNVTLDAARAAILDHVAERDAVGTMRRLPVDGGTTNGIGAALDARMGVRGAQGDHRPLIELAAVALEHAGQRIDRKWSRQELVSRALSSSDFPHLLADSAGRVLAQAFNQAPPALKAVARQNMLPDFRARTVVRVGGAPDLREVNENGEFTHSYVSDAAASYRLHTYGRIIGMSRQAMINDDLVAFTDLLRKFAESAGRLEGDILANLLISNPDIDGTALFHADRGTLLTGAGSAFGQTGLQNAIKALRMQKEMDGGFISQEARFLIVPAALEFVARQWTFGITPTKTADANPLGQNLQVVVEPRLDAASATAWYLATDSGALEYGYLEGQAGLYTETRNGFEVDGLEIKARLDFGAGFVSPTGWIKSAGA